MENGTSMATSTTVRASMAALIQRTRNHIRGTDGDVDFSDDEIQEALDRYRTVVPTPTGLMPALHFAPGGNASFHDYYADFSQAAVTGLGFQLTLVGGHSVRGMGTYKQPKPLPDWEDDAVLYDSTFTPLTPDVADTITGHWHFNTGVGPPVYITGAYYDINATCADLLDQWAVNEMLSFDATGDKVDAKRSQKFEMIQKAAARFRSRVRPRVIQAVRSDMRGY